MKSLGRLEIPQVPWSHLRGAGSGHSYGFSSLIRLEITLVVQGIESLLRRWVTSHFGNLKTLLWLVFTLGWLSVDRGQISSMGSLRWHEVILAAKGYSHSKERTLTSNLFLTIKIHFYWTQFVMYCFDWNVEMLFLNFCPKFISFFSFETMIILICEMSLILWR
jgi:hypothetical protein